MEQSHVVFDTICFQHWFSTVVRCNKRISAPRGWIRGSSHTCHQTDIWTGSESSTAHLGHILATFSWPHMATLIHTTQTATPRPSAPDSRISRADITFFGPSMRSHQWLYFFAHDSDSETGRLSLAACRLSRSLHLKSIKSSQVPSPPKSSIPQISARSQVPSRWLRC